MQMSRARQVRDLGNPMEESREAEAIRDVLRGNPRAFEMLVRKYERPVYNLMLRTVGNEGHAADLAQEAFLRAYEKLGTFRNGKRFFPWLYAISLNVCRDWLRRQGRDPHVYVEDANRLADAGAASQQDTLQSRLDGRRMFDAMTKLPLAYREALVMRFREEFSMREIAQALDISVSGAKMRVSRGLDMLRKQFTEASDD